MAEAVENRTAFRELFVFFLGATEECAVYSMQYAQYVLIAAPFMIGTFLLSLTLRNEGNATRSMFGLSIGGLLHIALDPLFIFTLGFSVSGTSMATAISKSTSFILARRDWPVVWRWLTDCRCQSASRSLSTHTVCFAWL